MKTKQQSNTTDPYLIRLHAMRWRYLGLTDWVGPDYGEKMKRGEAQWAQALATVRESVTPSAETVTDEPSVTPQVLQAAATVTDVTLCPVCGSRPLVGKQKVCSGACRVKQKRQKDRKA